MKHIRHQIVWLALLPLLLLAFCAAGLFLHDRYAALDQALVMEARMLADRLAAGGERSDEVLRNQIQSALQHTDVQSVSILDAQRKPRGSAENIEHDPARNHPARVALRMDTPVYSGAGRQIGTVVVTMSGRNADRQKLILLAWTLASAVIIVGISIYLILIASRRITRPINKLCSDLQHIVEANPHSSQLTFTADVCELGNLSQNISLLTDKLQGEHELLQHKLEAETQVLRQKKDMAERNSLNSSRFLAVASHELRQPLHALSLYISELQRKAVGAELQHLTGQINHSVEVLTSMLNGLLDISKLDARSVVPQIQACSMSGLLERVSANHVMVARIKNVRLVVRPCVCHVLSDPVLLERIIMNLIGNAIRYTEPGGSVLVACRRRGKHIHLEVRDNGIGIAPEDHENIFREFHQCKHPKYDASKGLGLGLAIVDRLTRLLGHQLSLRSAPNKGSVFVLKIPTAPASITPDDHAATGSPQASSSLMAGKKILIVDDDPLILESTVHILSAWGCNVSSADSLKSVTERLAAGETWDLVITDYQLEDHITGLNIIHTLKERHTHAVPCILITGNTSQELSKLINAGGGHVLYKPVRPAKLRSLVEFLLRGPDRQDEFPPILTN